MKAVDLLNYEPEHSFVFFSSFFLFIDGGVLWFFNILKMSNL